MGTWAGIGIWGGENITDDSQVYTGGERAFDAAARRIPNGFDVARRAILVAMLLLPTVGAAPWLQEGGDAGRTSATRDPGPDAADVAWRVQLDGIRSPLGAPILIDRALYVPLYHGANDTTIGRVVRISLDDARVETVLTLEERGQSLASDGDVLVVATERRILAVGLRDLAPRWTYELPQFVPQIDQVECASPAVLEGVAYVLCWQVQFGYYFTYLAGAQHRAFVVALDLASGSELWLWQHGISDDAEGFGPLRPATVPEADPATLPVVISGVSAAGPRVYALLGQVLGTGGAISMYNYALDRASGQMAWRVNSTSSLEAYQRFVEPSDPGALPANFLPPPAVADAGTVYTVFDEVAAHEAVNGRPLWSIQPSESTGTDLADVAAEIALHERALYTATRSTIARIDLDTTAVAWRRPLGANESWGQGGLAFAGDRIYAMAASYADTSAEASHDALLAYDAETGDLLWRFDMGLQNTSRAHIQRENDILAPGCYLAAADGLVAAACVAGAVWLFGQTAASPVVAVSASDRYPGVNEEAVVDLSGSAPGLRGPVVEYAADWGDGARTEWQTDPMMRHAYAEAGAVEARFFARNAEQSSSRAMTFHVGASPPTFLQTAFSAENQNWTFFLVGLAITAIGGAFGIVRPRRRRARLRAAIHTVNEAYERTRADPLVCEREMARQRDHARARLLDGSLGEDQYTVVAGHIGERMGETRLAFLRSRYAFLPLGVAEQLRAMLADGTVTRLEHQHLVAALDQDATMTPEQKQQVRALLAQWADRDG